MGTQAYAHGRIVLGRDIERSRAFLSSLSDDAQYPWIRTEMFSMGATERPYYYEQQVVAFAASYKGLEDDIKAFVLKFEHILRHIDFDTAKVEIETEYMGTHHLFWRSKQTDCSNLEDECLIETSEWLFGMGYRSRWGTLLEDLPPQHFEIMGFEYPIRFDALALEQLYAALDAASDGEKVYLDHMFKLWEPLYPILVYHQLRDEIRYGIEAGKGYWAIRLKPFEKLAG